MHFCVFLSNFQKDPFKIDFAIGHVIAKKNSFYFCAMLLRGLVIFAITFGLYFQTIQES